MYTKNVIEYDEQSFYDYPENIDTCHEDIKEIRKMAGMNSTQTLEEFLDEVNKKNK